MFEYQQTKYMIQYLKQKTGITIIILLTAIQSYGQLLKYDITYQDIKVGQMMVERKDSAGFTHYHVSTKTELNLGITTRSSDMYSDVWFDKQGKLVSSYYHNVKNDGTIVSKAESNNGVVTVDVNGEKSKLNAPVTLSSSMMYFGEPKQLQGIFSERAGKLFDLKKQPDGTYLAKLDGGTGKYTYSNNKLVSLELSKGILGSLVMKLVQ